MRALACASVFALAIACGNLGEGPGAQGPTINVFAAASLTAAFKKLAADFQRPVAFNFAGSPTLVTQIEQGAKADVFASADTTNMEKLEADGFTSGDAKVFAHNTLEIVVAAGNPKKIASFADLARPGVVYIAAGPTVPAGRYAAQALARAGVKVTPRSLETDVKSVVSKVQLGEADAGIVYTTDVKAAGAKVSGVPIPDKDNILATYPISVVKGANRSSGDAFIAYVLSPVGQATLRSYGFKPA